VITWQEWQDYYAEMSMTIGNTDYFIEMLSSCYCILEHADLSEADKKMVAKSLELLKRGCLQKVPSTMSQDAGIRNLFLTFDKEKNGYFTLNEVNALCLAVGVPLERKYTMRILRALDKDNNRRVDLEEFREFLLGQRKD